MYFGVTSEKINFRLKEWHAEYLCCSALITKIEVQITYTVLDLYLFIQLQYNYTKIRFNAINV